MATTSRQTDQAQREEFEFDQVRPGENFQIFCERVGVHPDRVLELNRPDMELEARGRGFDLHFMRQYKNEDGSEGLRPDYHVFGGQILRLRPHEEEQ